MKHLLCATAAAALLATTACTATPPAKPVATVKPGKPIPVFDDSLELQTQNGVTFVTGGIGEDERTEIEASKANFNLHLTSAMVDGSFVEYTMVKISDAAGNPVIETEAGPLLYAQLAPGKYTLVATNDSQESTRKFTLGKKPLDLHVRWKPVAAK